MTDKIDGLKAYHEDFSIVPHKSRKRNHDKVSLQDEKTRVIVATVLVSVVLLAATIATGGLALGVLVGAVAIGAGIFGGSAIAGLVVSSIVTGLLVESVNNLDRKIDKIDKYNVIFALLEAYQMALDNPSDVSLEAKKAILTTLTSKNYFHSKMDAKTGKSSFVDLDIAALSEDQLDEVFYQMVQKMQISYMELRAIAVETKAKANVEELEAKLASLSKTIADMPTFFELMNENEREEALLDKAMQTCAKEQKELERLDSLVSNTTDLEVENAKQLHQDSDMKKFAEEVLARPQMVEDQKEVVKEAELAVNNARVELEEWKLVHLLKLSEWVKLDKMKEVAIAELKEAKEDLENVQIMLAIYNSKKLTSELGTYLKEIDVKAMSAKKFLDKISQILMKLSQDVTTKQLYSETKDMVVAKREEVEKKKVAAIKIVQGLFRARIARNKVKAQIATKIAAVIKGKLVRARYKQAFISTKVSREMLATIQENLELNGKEIEQLFTSQVQLEGVYVAAKRVRDLEAEKYAKMVQVASKLMQDKKIDAENTLERIKNTTFMRKKDTKRAAAQKVLDTIKAQPNNSIKNQHKVYVQAKEKTRVAKNNYDATTASLAAKMVEISVAIQKRLALRQKIQEIRNRELSAYDDKRSVAIQKRLALR